MGVGEKEQGREEGDVKNQTKSTYENAVGTYYLVC